MTAVVAIQGGHVVEHIAAASAGVRVLGVPEQDALGLLGYVLQFNGTEEWLHLGYNVFYLLALYVLIIPLWRITPALVPTLSAFRLLHHGQRVARDLAHGRAPGVIISHVIANGGCPCPGDRGRRARIISDTVLHFIYNAIAYAGIAYAYVVCPPRPRRQPALARPPDPSAGPRGTEPRDVDTRDRVRLSG